MGKSSISLIFGVLIIIIIVLSTSLISALPHFEGGKAAAPPAAAVVATPKAAIAQQAPAETPGALLNADQNKDNTSPRSAFARTASAEALPEATVLPPVQKSRYVQYDSEAPGENDDLYERLRYVPVPVETLPPQEYVEIFHENQAFVYNSTAIWFNLRNAPMKISFNVSPKMLTDLKYVKNRDAHKTTDGKIVNVSRYDEDSWFLLTVFDKENENTVIIRDGFGREHGEDVSKDLIIRNPGYYQLRFEGDFVSVETSITVPKDGNF